MIDKECERETHVKELNVWILLSRIMSGLKIGVMELCWSTIELGQRDIRIARARVEFLSNFLSHFHLTAKPHPSCLCHCLSMTAPSFLILVLPAMTKALLTSGPERIIITISHVVLFTQR